jgi:LuxR family transcriptional regulator, maltose regulon positive regulatory protein
MNAKFILESKLNIPQLNNSILKRQRLFDRLNESLDRNLILLSCSAGYGKTMLLSQWCNSTDMTIMWYTLDKTDNSLNTFLYYLV